MLAQCASEAPQDRSDQPQPLFREAAVETGLVFRHFIGATGSFYLPEIMGPGVALLDYDLDGDLDVYLLQGSTLDADSDPADSLFPPNARLGNRLFENRIVPDGTLTFVDSTEGSGLGIESVGMGVAVGDYDADGDPDLYVTSVGPNFLLRNVGEGTYEVVEGPQDSRWSTSAAFADYDSDGDLDLFFTNFVDFSVANNKECFATTGERDYCIPTVYQPLPDRLYRNDGGRFTDVSAVAGLSASFGNGLGIAAADFNNDGRTDLYVANDTTENQLWINLGNDRFEDHAMQGGAGVNMDGRVEAGMGIAVADFDSDYDEDILVTHNVHETNTLYVNFGNGLFSDSTNRYGLGNPSLAYTGFGVAWADFNNDGHLDVFAANGAVAVIETQRGEPFPFVQENQLYLGGERGFEVMRAAAAWGPIEAKVSRGLSIGDLDLDGDLDLVVTNCNGPVRLYLNQTDGDRWLRARLVGRNGTSGGLGARVGLCSEDGPCSWRRVHRDGSYLSSSEAAAHFGLREGHAPTHLEVHWTSGTRERFPLNETGTVVILEEGAGTPVSQ